MKKLFFIALAMILSVSVIAQQKIQLRSADKAECVKSDMRSLKASFSFSTIDAQDIQSERGTFSWLSLPNTVIGGNEGDPQIPVVNELIAVPFGANPRIEITSYSSTDYRLEDYGIHTLVPRQPSLRKDQRPEEVPFVYNASAYQTRGLRSAPQAVVSVNGTMRGIQVGKMTIEPVSYDPVNNTLRVFNDIEVIVHFDEADVRATEEMLVKTYTPYFDVVYAQMFNSRMLRDAYSEHPDLYSTPVKMMVITTSTYANNQTFQDWVNWKKQKGFYTTVYTTATTGTTAANIKSFIRNKYSTEAPTFIIIVGDTDAVTYSLNSSTTDKVTDLYYSTTDDNDLWPEMFLSRMPISSTTELENLLNKIMTYEKYTMADPSYLSKVLLIAGSDGTWNPRVGQPTINYAADNYFNTAHGFTNVYKYLDSYSNCYNNMNTGIGFANYTAHGGETGWSGPSFSVSDANNLTNEDKYFWAMGNCCLAANWGYSGVCLAEALLRSQNKGAFGYIGSCPETYWWEDYYFGVGATTVTNSTPSMSQTQTGTYDGMFMDDMYNTLNSVPFLGNVAVAYAHANSYTSSVSDKYYWEAYHTLGDGSVMPYHVNPAANNVSHASAIGIGLTTFTVNADPGSYVAISKDNELLGAAQVDGSGTVNVPITPVTSGGDVLVVVTRNQRQPYMQTIPAVSLEGPYISIDGYTPNSAHVGDNTNLSISFKNVGADATTGNTTVTLTAVDSNSTIVANTGTQTFGVLAADATTTVSGFQFKINSGVADGTIVPLHYRAVNGSNTWEGNFNITANEAVLEYAGMTWDGGFTPGETLTVSAKFRNVGHWQATNAVIRLTSSSDYVTVNTQPISAGTLEVGQEVTYDFSVTIAANCPETAQLPIAFTMTADGGLSATGNETLKNACNVVFNLVDSYGDGWNGNVLTASFSDGSPSQEMTISTGNSAEYVLEIGNGTHVTLTWTTGSYASECSFSVSYEGDLIIYQSSGTPNAGVLYEFDCNCAAASQTFMVTVASESTEHGTVTGGGEFSYGQTCTVTATANEGYFFTGWTWNGEVVSGATTYTFVVTSDMNLVAHFAEGHMVGDGGEATDSYLPTYNYYNYSLTEQIYTSEELGEAGMITSIAFFNGGAEKTRTLVFYMKATEKATFTGSNDWVTVSEADKVFSGSVTMTADAWTFITFDTPFLYDGSSNVVLVTDDNSGAYTSSPHMTCRVFDAASQALRICSDGTNYDPYAPTSYSGTVMDKKNQLLFTKESLGDCVRPTNLTATEIGPDFVTFDWTENGASEEWYIFYGESLETAVVVDHHPYTLTGLTPETTYQANVFPSCGIDDPSTTFASNLITFTTLEACPVPSGVEVTNITGNAVTVNWVGYSESYLVQLGVPAFLVSESFESGIPAGWSNDATYPWTVVDGHMQSGNGGQGNSTSSITATVTYPSDGTISFDFWSMGEGTNDSYDWDKSRFYIDGVLNIDYGAHTGWESFSAEVTAGTHTFTWEYKKDGSVNPTGDCFIVDNVEMRSGETVWSDPVSVGEASHTFRGLSPLTTYCVRVQGVCGEEATEWSETAVFTTTDATTVTETVSLTAGWNWFSLYVEVEDPVAMLQAVEAALGENGIQIKSSQVNTEYDSEWGWFGDLDDIGMTNEQMYAIDVIAPCTLTVEGIPANPASHTITINQGWNWIGFPSGVAISLEDAFAGFAQEGDKIKNISAQIEYDPEWGWFGDFENLEPGQGYMYYSASSTPRTLVFPAVAK